ncbi:hypothetical protein [Kytococcus sedentarius]|uniref:hypothetical protein n=1 Tax=Kytococcus sedentarius TaxID=1276 RepID=UPI0035BC02D3
MTSRWDDLFADLEGQLAAHRRAELEDEVAERVRIERSRIDLADRLAAHLGHRLTLRTADGGSVTGDLQELGSDWLRLEAERSRLAVPLTAVHGVLGMGARSRPAEGDVRRRITWGAVLRGLSRDRLPVRVALVTGHVLEGRVERVLADHLDLVVGHDARRPAAVETLASSAVCWISSRED